MLLSLCLFKHESLQFLIKKGREKEALSAIQSLYKSDNSYVHNQILQEFIDNVQMAESLKG